MQFIDPSAVPLSVDAMVTPLEGQPAIGKELSIELAMTADADSIDEMILRRDDGTPLVNYTPVEVRAGHYSVDFVPPSEPFLIEVSGRSTGGMHYLRQTLVPVHPQSVSMRIDPKMARGTIGTAVDINVSVSNTGDTDAVYSLTANSDVSWKIELPATVDVAAGDSVTVTLRIWVPTDALEGESTNVVILAQDSVNALVRNNASVKVSAIVNRPPICTEAQASDPILLPWKHHLHWFPHWLTRWWSPYPLHHRHDSMVVENILGVTDPDSDALGITITAITQDEPVSSHRGDHTSPDGIGIGAAEAAVRIERDPHRDGRVYAIHFNAEDGKGGSCSGVVNVSVPHDRHHPAVDSGQDYDSTQR
jgi:hypothetical protein